MLLGQCYVAGYYTYEEAMDKSLELGKKLQSMFASWEDFMQSYMYGFVYWSKSDPNETAVRVSVPRRHLSVSELPGGRSL